MPTTQARKALASVLAVVHPGDDSPGAFTVLPQRPISLGLVAVGAISVVAVL